MFIILQEDFCVYVIQFDPSFFFTVHLYNSSIAHLLLILPLLTELQLTDFEKHLFSIPWICQCMYIGQGTKYKQQCIEK